MNSYALMKACHVNLGWEVTGFILNFCITLRWIESLENCCDIRMAACGNSRIMSGLEFVKCCTGFGTLQFEGEFNAS